MGEHHKTKKRYKYITLQGEVYAKDIQVHDGYLVLCRTPLQ